MKITIPFIIYSFILICINPASAQRKLNTDTINISKLEIFSSRLSFENNDIIIAKPEYPKVGNYKNIFGPNPKFNISNSDLEIHFFLNPKKDTEGYFSIKIDSIINQGEIVPISMERIYGDIGNEVSINKNLYKIVIANSADNFNPLFLSGAVRLYVTVVHFDYRIVRGRYGAKVKCVDNLKISEEINGWTFKEGYLGETIGGGVAAISLGLSYYYYWKSRDIYKNEYKKLYKEKGAAENDYDRANNRHKVSVGLLIGGAVMSGVTFTWWRFHKKLLKERKKIYDCGCFNTDCAMLPIPKERFNIELFNPSFQNSNDLLLSNSGIGIRLNF